MKAKKFRQQARKHWKIEVKKFVAMCGEVLLERPVFPRVPLLRRWKREPAAAKLRVRLQYAIAILRAPGRARAGKLVEYIANKWPGATDGLHEQGWVRYQKQLGPLCFHCRTRREAPGVLIQVLVQEKYWDEKKAIQTLSKDIQRIYHAAPIVGVHYQEALQAYKDLVEAEAEKTVDLPAKVSPKPPARTGATK